VLVAEPEGMLENGRTCKFSNGSCLNWYDAVVVRSVVCDATTAIPAIAVKKTAIADTSSIKTCDWRLAMACVV
jgi:hypothetical protein